MNSFRQIDRQTLQLWALLLSLALLCAQGAKLHVHNLDHGHHHNDYHGHTHDAIDGVDDHSHLSKAHFTHDTSHNDHHGGVVSEIEVASDGPLKNSNNNIFAIVLFVLFFTLIISAFSRQPIQRCRESKLVIRSRYILSPPLRAPPLY